LTRYCLQKPARFSRTSCRRRLPYRGWMYNRPRVRTATRESWPGDVSAGVMPSRDANREKHHDTFDSNRRRRGLRPGNLRGVCANQTRGFRHSPSGEVRLGHADDRRRETLPHSGRGTANQRAIQPRVPEIHDGGDGRNAPEHRSDPVPPYGTSNPRRASTTSRSWMRPSRTPS